MDLNQLLFQHQAAMIRDGAAAASQAGSRFDIVSHYERRIARLRTALGVSHYPAWCDKASV